VERESSDGEEEQRLNTVDDYNAVSETGDGGMFQPQMNGMPRAKNSSISPNRLNPFYLSNQMN